MGAARPPFAGGWTVVPLALVVLMLLGSVLIPAGLTSRVLRLLREVTEIIDPARRIQTELAAGLAEESAALQGYALSGDSALLKHYRATAADDERRLTTVELLARELDGEAVGRVAAVRRSASEWRQRNHALLQGRVPRAEFAATLRSQHAGYDSTLGAVDRLSSYFASEAVERAARASASERLSLLVNASLVLVALAAVFAVTALIHRERRLTVILRRRIDEEAGLREAAEALGSSFTVDEVTQAIARSALKALQGRGAFVEHITSAAADEAQLVVRESAGDGVPTPGTATSYAGSYTELVLRGGGPVLVPDLARGERSCSVTTPTDAACSAILLPLGDPATPVGVLFILGATETPFSSDDLPRAATFAHLAALAYEKARLLEEARAGREELERVMKSRSRLMRGFSHDVKNPLGAADGYAELLTADIYGALSTDQRTSIERIRRSIHSALALIDDLHELARAETGHLALSEQLVDLGDLVRSTGEEYRAAAKTHGLSLFVESEPGPSLVKTDPTRVRQIIGNLLSNAIKYTAAGSVTVRTRRRQSGGVGDTLVWAAIEVSDTGAGIPPDKRTLIFEEFVRLGAAADRSGAGLGLSISSRLAQLLGGRISLQSEVGRGSTFTVWLPLHESGGPAMPGQSAGLGPTILEERRELSVQPQPVATGSVSADARRRP